MTKHAVPVIMGYFTFDSWLQSKQNDFKATYYQKAYNTEIAKEQAANVAKSNAELATKTLESQNGIVSQNIDRHSEDISKYSQEVSKIQTKIINGDLTQQEANSQLEYYKYMQKQSSIALDQEVKNLNSLSESKDPDIFKSDFSEYFFNLRDILQDYLSIFSSEQLAILFNISGFLFVFLLLTTITILIIGNDLINYYQLEFKYPKLAKYIQFQLTLRQYYLRFYIVYLYFVILI